ncbi:phage tail protein [Photobacterium kasasachensis]|uniref:phage tail protein n=1 Tax=Photobacterium kasasachensis TaxID=2910240 RepID=UPI003D11105D
MTEPFIGEIRMFGGNFAPRDWAFCDGQLLSISQNEALFSLVNTYYGGDGRSTFALPDLRGRLPMHYGSGPGLQTRLLGSRFGYEKIPLSKDQIPSHNHDLMASSQAADDDAPGGNTLATPAVNAYGPQSTTPTKNVTLAATAVSDTGGSQPHYNLMPSLCINFIIALKGTYPSRN